MITLQDIQCTLEKSMDSRSAGIDDRAQSVNTRRTEALRPSAVGLRCYYLEIRLGRISNCSNDRDTRPRHLACRFPRADLKLTRKAQRAAVAEETKVTRPRLRRARVKSVRYTIAFVAPKLYQLQTLAASPSPMLTKH